MKETSRVLKNPSRREVARLVAGTLVAAPLAASLSACSGREENKNQQPSQQTVNDGPTMSPCGETAREEHFPPIGLGGGSFNVELLREITLRNPQGPPPFTYSENIDPANSYGPISVVRVITEAVRSPYITDVAYFGLPLGSQLLIWYQTIAATPSSPEDCDYPADNYNRDPDVRITGNPFTMNVRRRVLEPREISHKCKRPFRYRHREGGQERHFRIGKWALVDSAGTPISDGSRPFSDSGAESYKIYVTCDHYQP